MDNILQIFQNEISSQNFSLLAILLSFLGGVLASISPCSLGILPIIIGYIGGYNKEDTKNTIIQLFFFILGMSVLLTFVGIICAISGKVFSSLLGPIGILVLTSFILLMGINLIGLIEINIPVLIKQFPQNKNNNIILYPFIIGALFALASSPCSTPILASIMAFASLSANLLLAILLLFAFALGQGVIIIFAGLFTNIIKNFRNFASCSEIFLKICGYILIFAAFYMYYKIFSPFF